ncbi:unnamed protein product [Bathycoccus prasinos]
MSRQVGFNLESISLSSSSSSEEEEEEEDACDFEARTKEETETRKVLRYDAEDVTTTTKNNHHHHPFASSNKGESGTLLDAHERNVREVLRKAICVDEEGEYSSDFEEEEEKRTEVATKEDREKEEEKEDFNAAPASTTTTTTTATFLGPKPPPRRFQSAFDIARKALRREEHFLSATTTTQTTSTDATLVVDAHAFGGKAFRGSWAGTSGRFAFCDGSKIVERAVVPVEDKKLPFLRIQFWKQRLRKRSIFRVLYLLFTQPTRSAGASDCSRASSSDTLESAMRGDRACLVF